MRSAKVDDLSETVDVDAGKKSSVDEDSAAEESSVGKEAAAGNKSVPRSTDEVV